MIDMAKKDALFVKAKALINLKYDKDVVKIGQEFKIKVEDAQEIADRGCIELLEELPKEEETPKDGE